MSSSSVISGTVGRDMPVHGVDERKKTRLDKEYAPREIGAALRGVLTGVGAVSEDDVPLDAPIGLAALFSSDIMCTGAYITRGG